MSEVIDSIRQEHRNLAKLLSLLDREIGMFRESGSPDWDLVRDILAYLMECPDRYHHPKEDVVLEVLQNRSPEEAAAVGKLADEHQILSDLTRRFQAAVDNVLQDETLTREWFLGVAEDFLKFQRRHMQMEEVVFLPAAARALNDDDWAAVEARLDEAEDPLFGDNLDDRFQILRNEISAQGAN